MAYTINNIEEIEIFIIDEIPIDETNYICDKCLEKHIDCGN